MEIRGFADPLSYVARSWVPTPPKPECILQSSITILECSEFSPNEVERHLERAVEELRIMRSRGNIRVRAERGGDRGDGAVADAPGEGRRCCCSCTTSLGG